MNSEYLEAIKEAWSKVDAQVNWDRETVAATYSTDLDEAIANALNASLHDEVKKYKRMVERIKARCHKMIDEDGVNWPNGHSAIMILAIIKEEEDTND